MQPSAAEAAANLVHVATAFLNEIPRRRTSIARLSPTAFQALAVLQGAGEPLPSNVMAGRLLVSTASATSLVDTLERNELGDPLRHTRRIWGVYSDVVISNGTAGECARVGTPAQ